MIQFLGLHLDARSGTAVALGRDLAIWASSETRVMNTTADSGGQAVAIPPAEWTRAGCYALQEAYFELPTKARKVWGLGVTAPSGWIALDFNYEPLSPLRLLPGGAVGEDVSRWQKENSRAAARVAAILAPKDYFRFVITGGLATDVTEVDHLGCLRRKENEWSETALQAAGLRRDRVPPVFASHAPTGRLSESGVRRSSLPGGTWVVAGAHEDAAGLISAADLREATLWLVERRDKPPVAARGVARDGDRAPAPWTCSRAAIAGYHVLERVLSEAQEPQLTDPETTAPLTESLDDAGYGVESVALTTANPAVGAAALAAVGSGLIKDWDRYYGALEEDAEED